MLALNQENLNDQDQDDISPPIKKQDFYMNRTAEKIKSDQVINSPIKLIQADFKGAPNSQMAFQNSKSFLE